MAREISAPQSIQASHHSPAVSAPALPPLPVAIEAIGVTALATLGSTISSKLVDLGIADIGASTEQKHSAWAPFRHNGITVRWTRRRKLFAALHLRHWQAEWKDR
jgi:hypothetical protein